MQKLYLEFPEISEITANIISKRENKGQSQLILDRTIFMPKTQGLLSDSGFINGKKILAVENKRDNIIHTVEGKIDDKPIILSLNMINRSKNLTYNTIFIIFKMIFESIYTYKEMNLSINDQYGEIFISNFFDQFDYKLIENQVNFIIAKGVPIESENGITSIYPIGEVINNNFCFTNTAKALGFRIKQSIQGEKDLRLSFVGGKDIL